MRLLSSLIKSTESFTAMVHVDVCITAVISASADIPHSTAVLFVTVPECYLLQQMSCQRGPLKLLSEKVSYQLKT